VRVRQAHRDFGRDAHDELDRQALARTLDAR
jgi:hypothetical protein